MLRTSLLLALLAAGAVVVAGYRGVETGEAQMETRRIPRSDWLFDVPVDAPVVVQRLDRRDVLVHPDPAPPDERPTFSRRHDFGEFSRVFLWFTHPPSDSRLFVGALSGSEEHRIVLNPSRPHEAFWEYPQHSAARYLDDPNPHLVVQPFRFRLLGHFPLDRVSVLPDVAVHFSRTPADRLFDQIMESLRREVAD